jgi:hypothetical protein
VTPSDAVNWAQFLDGLRVIPEVSINVERYRTDCATRANAPGDPAELADREAFYRSRSVSLGPSFEIRYWVNNH